MKNIKVVFVLLAVILVLSGCTNGKTISNKKKDTDQIVADLVSDVLTFDEMMESATHIVDAVYSGESDNGTMVFEVADTLKGELSEASINVYDNDSSHVYKKGVRYLLFLIKTISVYSYDCPRYESIGNSLITENDVDWKEKHETIENAKGKFVNSKTEYGVPFIVSDDLAEVVAFSSCIFVVTVESIYAESTIGPTTVYACVVKECIKGRIGGQTEIDGTDCILITIFNDTVKLNSDYIVLLRYVGDTSVIYALASPKLSVFDLSHYDEIKALIA